MATGKLAAVAVGELDSPGRNGGGFGPGLMASTIATPAAMATARTRATGSSQRGPRRRRTTESAFGGAYRAGWESAADGEYCAGRMVCVCGGWTACVVGLGGGTTWGSGSEGVNAPDSSTADA